jgi:hypothetical protein
MNTEIVMAGHAPGIRRSMDLWTMASRVSSFVSDGDYQRNLHHSLGDW